ncbi:MAG: hypothetical protein J6L65_08045 [Lachnospiraceae bacterium]|nr:hypothetical protein [Lachnospiraceae bacterium]
MEQLMNYMDSKGLRTSYLPLLDNPVYYGILDDFDVTFLINPRGLPELIISTAIPENENLKSFSDYLSNIDLKATYHIQSYSITESCMHFKWNFHPDKFNPQDIIAFIDWFFPLLKKYGATPANICTECGRPMNQTNSGWYNISGTAATIHLHKRCRGKIARNTQQASALIFKKYPTYKRGILGAIIGAIPATFLWAFTYRFGDIVVPTGMANLFLIWLGYTFNCGFRGKMKPLIIYGLTLCSILLGYLAHPLFAAPIPSMKATDPAVLLFLSHSFAVFLLLCIWIAEVAISASYKKAGLSGIIKLK